MDYVINNDRQILEKFEFNGTILKVYLPNNKEYKDIIKDLIINNSAVVSESALEFNTFTVINYMLKRFTNLDIDNHEDELKKRIKDDNDLLQPVFKKLIDIVETTIYIMLDTVDVLN